MDLKTLGLMAEDIIDNDEFKKTFSFVGHTRKYLCISHLIFNLLNEQDSNNYKINKDDDYEKTKKFIIEKLIETYETLKSGKVSLYYNHPKHRINEKWNISPTTKLIVCDYIEKIKNIQKIPYGCILDDNNQAYSFYYSLRIAGI